MAARDVSYLRDPIYGPVALSPGEAELLTLPLMARLRGIKQMAFAGAFFPGANHTRFEHSVGVMHAAGLLASQLPGFSDRERRMVRLAGLLHDVGHPPFSHTLEMAARLFGPELHAPELAAVVSHEKVTEHRVRTDPELRAWLERTPEFEGIGARDLALLAVGRHPDRALSLLVHGEIDADRIDYIVRDNHHCGFPSGVDVHLLPTLFFRTLSGELVLHTDRAYFAEQLLLARHHLQVKIHDDPRDRFADLLLARALRRFFLGADREARRAFARTVEVAGDAELLGLLKSSVPAEVRELEAHLAGRSPWVPLAEIGFAEISPPGRYAVSLLLSGEHRDLSARLSALLGRVAGTDVIADVWGATPPAGTLRAGEPASPSPPVPLTTLPLIRGTVAATHRAMGVRLYTRAKGAAPRFSLAPAQARYQEQVDAAFDAGRAKRLFERLAPAERPGFLVSLELESALQQTLGEAHRSRSFPPDALLLLLSALFESFAAPPLEEMRVYLEGSDGLGLAARVAELPQTWSQQLKARFPYELPPEHREPEVPPTRPDPALEADLDRLEAFGLIVRLAREERRGRHFASRDRFALSGWGRGLVHRLVAGDARLAKVHAAAEERLGTLVREHEAEFRAFFDLTGRRDASARQQRRGRRGELPLPVSR